MINIANDLSHNADVDEDKPTDNGVGGVDENNSDNDDNICNKSDNNDDEKRPWW